MAVAHGLEHQARLFSDMWRCTDDQRLRLCQLATEEHGAQRICPVCVGSGWETDHIGQTIQICPICDGRGRLLWRQRRRAEWFGTHRNNWQRRWAERYEQVMALLHSVEADALHQIKRYLSD